MAHRLFHGHFDTAPEGLPPPELPNVSEERKWAATVWPITL